jgi:twitching motility protein PilI
MANRQALRELQDRLAQRLQAARSQGVAQSWLAVESGGVKYLIPLAQAGEIFPYYAPQGVPYTKEWYLGVANLRGGLFGVVDLSSFVSGSKPIPRSDMGRAEARFIAFNSALEVNCAVLIDKLAGLRNADAFVEVREGQGGYLSRHLVDAAGVAWQELDVQRLCQDQRFLSIAS